MAVRPIGIDLFAGAGGLSLGFEQAGFDIVAAVEIDPIHCASHEFNFPHCKVICKSVVDVDSEYIREKARLTNDTEIDVVFGGAPCQGFSMIGKRALDDPRNSLVFHFVRLVLELQPRYFVFENVKGLTQGSHRRFLEEIIQEFEKGGYQILLPYKVLNAVDYGVPQDRKRLFLIGTRKDQKIPQYPEPTFRTNIFDAIADLPDLDQFEELKLQDHVQVSWNSQSQYARILRGQADDPTDFSFGRSFNRDELTSSLRTDHSIESQNRFLATINGNTEPISRFKKLAFDSVCNTLRAGTDSARGAFTSPRPIHPLFPRVISVREAARLHSYPDWFRFHVTKWHGFRQVGNSVPPLLGRNVAKCIIESLGIIPEKPSETFCQGQPFLLHLDMRNAAKYYGVSSKTIPQRVRASSLSDFPTLHPHVQ
jgi:DNA (cytosine-5)-methyltransferase 1